jgi:hypothetical protein
MGGSAAHRPQKGKSPMETTTNRKKVVEITRPVIVYGEHAAAGEQHELPVSLANELIGSGVARAVDDDDPPTTVRTDEVANREPRPLNADPVPARRSPAQQLTPKNERPGVQRPQPPRPGAAPASGPTRK